MSDAIAAVPENAGDATTIELIASTKDGLQIPAGKKVILDLNGNTLTVDAGSDSYDYILGELTIKDTDTGTAGKVIVDDYGIAPKGSGKLTIENGAFETKDADDYYMFYLMGGELVVNGGTFTGSYNIVNCYADGNLALGGKATIKGGTFTVSDSDGVVVMGYANSDIAISGGTFDGAYAVWTGKGTVNDGVTYTAAKMTITGGTFNGAAGADGDATLAIYDGLFDGGLEAEDGGTIVISGGYFTEEPALEYCAEGLCPIGSGREDKYKYTVGAAVAKIGETLYATLEEAVAAAADGDTIELLADIALTERLFVNAGAEPAYAGSNNRYATTSENKSITLDLNGKNITSSSNIALAGGSLNIIGKGMISTSASGLAPIEIRGTGDLTNKRTLTIGEDVTLTGSEYGLNVFGSNDAQKNVIDVNVNGTVNGMLFVLGNLTNAENEINIVVNGTVDASNATGEEAVHTGIAISGNANVTVNDGATVKGESGIEVRAGSLTVNGGTITATANTYSYAANGNGTTTKGAAIAVAQHNTKLATTATLNGGSLSGVKDIVVTDVNGDMSGVSVVSKQSYTESSVIPEGYQWVETETEGMYELKKQNHSLSYGFTLDLKDRIDIPLYMYDLTDKDHPENYKVTWSIGEENENECTLDKIPLANAPGWYRIVVGTFPASYMTEKVHVIITYDNYGVETVIADRYYSVQDYCKNKIENSNNPQLVDLCKATLNYGRTAQLVFGHNTDDLAGQEDYYGWDYSATTIDETYNKKSVSDPYEMFTLVGMTLSLESRTEINFYFIPADGTFTGYTFKYGEEELHADVVGGYLRVIIPGISATSLNTEVTITCAHDGKTAEATYSALSYAYSKYQNGGTENLRMVSRALYEFYQKAMLALN